jgi:hypothetical protein
MLFNYEPLIKGNGPFDAHKKKKKKKKKTCSFQNCPPLKAAPKNSHSILFPVSGRQSSRQSAEDFGRTLTHAELLICPSKPKTITTSIFAFAFSRVYLLLIYEKTRRVIIPKWKCFVVFLGVGEDK